MSGIIRGNVVVGLGGGPTSVIAETLVGVLEPAMRPSEIGEVWVMKNGIDAMNTHLFYDARAETPETLARIADSTGAPPGSTRTNPAKVKGLPELTFDWCRRHNVRYFFYIGGDDSAKAAHIINGIAKEQEYELRIFHVPKTIDNNLVENDHTPGFGSAGRYVAYAVLGNGEDTRSIPGIKIDVIMGRDAGWLTAAAAMAKHSPEDAPHLMYFPERPVDVERIIEEIRNVYEGQGYCHVALSEGTLAPYRPADSADKRTTKPLLDALMEYLEPKGVRLMIADELKGTMFKTDDYGHPKLSAYSFLGDWLQMALIAQGGKLAKARIRAQTLGYTQRAYLLARSESDVKEARLVGTEAVGFAFAGNIDGSVALTRLPGDEYVSKAILVPLEKVAGRNRVLEDRFIEPDGKGVTPEFHQYAAPLVGDITPNKGFSKEVILK